MLLYLFTAATMTMPFSHAAQLWHHLAKHTMLSSISAILLMISGSPTEQSWNCKADLQSHSHLQVFTRLAHCGVQAAAADAT
jgi:hypothetical protein